MFRKSIGGTANRSSKPSPTADERSYHIFYAANVSPAMAMLSVHPTLYQLNDMPPNVGKLVTLEDPNTGQYNGIDYLM